MVIFFLSFLVLVAAIDEELTMQREALLRELESIAEAQDQCKNVSPLSPSQSADGDARIGICLTGQLSRLETESKLHHLIRPLSSRYVVDVVLVMDPSSARFVNDEFDGASSKLSSRIAASIFGRAASGEVVVDDSPQLERPHVNKDYLAMSDKPQLGEERVRAHVRQWSSLVTCYKHFAWLQAKRCASSSLEPQQIYSRFLKLRDDSWLLGEVDEIMNATPSSDVAVPDCLGYSGYNDKVAIVDSLVAPTFFTRPLYEYLFNFSGLGVRHGNPEHVLRRVLDKHEVRVDRVDVDDMPVFTSRLLSQRESCILFDRLKLGKESKCWPRSCDRRAELFCRRCPTSSDRQEQLFANEFFSSSEERLACPVPDCSSSSGSSSSR